MSAAVAETKPVQAETVDVATSNSVDAVAQSLEKLVVKEESGEKVGATEEEGGPPLVPTPAAPAAPQAAANATTTPAAAAAAPTTTSLFVGELDPSVTEAVLYEIFSIIGPVASIRVCRDAVHRRSLGYAYVNYLNAADGETALEQLNYSVIKGRQCRIMWSQRDPALRKTGAGNIFIKNLDENIDNKALHDTFAAFGNILSCKVAVEANGKSLGHGYIHYDNQKSAQAAIDGVNGMLLNDKVVYVAHHQPKRERQAKVDEYRALYTNVYIKNIPLEVTTEELRELFVQFGAVSSAVVTTDEAGKSKGFGFVNFEKHADAADAVAALHDKDFRGQNLFVTRAQRKSERDEELRKAYDLRRQEALQKYQGVNLYVKNIDDNINEEKFRALFEPFGTITSCKLVVENGVSRGFGFVCFSAPDEATKALTELNGKMIDSKPLYVGLAQRREVRRQHLEAQALQRSQFKQQQMAASMAIGMPQAGGMFFPPGPGGFPPGPRQMYPSQSGMAPRRFYGAAPVPGMPMAPMPIGVPFGQVPPQFPPAPQMQGMPRQQMGAPMPQQPQQQSGGPGGRNQGRTGGKFRGPDETIPGTNFTSAILASVSPPEQKQMLGEALYPKIALVQSSLAGKITGMLLDMEPTELLFLLDHEDALQGKIQEAIEVLEEYSRQPPAGEVEA